MVSEKLRKLELIKMNQPDNLCSRFTQTLKFFLRTQKLIEISFENEDARLRNVGQILLVKVWQLFLTQD